MATALALLGTDVLCQVGAAHAVPERQASPEAPGRQPDLRGSTCLSERHSQHQDAGSSESLPCGVPPTPPYPSPLFPTPRLSLVPAGQGVLSVPSPVLRHEMSHVRACPPPTKDVPSEQGFGQVATGPDTISNTPELLKVRSSVFPMLHAPELRAQQSQGRAPAARSPGWRIPGQQSLWQTGADWVLSCV